MEIIQLIADIAGATGMGFFLSAEVFQMRKILRTKLIVGISRTAYRHKLLAILLTLVCFGLTALWLSFAVIFVEGIVAVIILCLIKKYGKKKFSDTIKIKSKEELIW